MLDRPTKTISAIIKGNAIITREIAEQLERAVGAPADFWLTREGTYREWRARDK